MKRNTCIGLGLLVIFISQGVNAQTMEEAAVRSPGFTRLLDSVVRLDVWETELSDGAQRTLHGVGSGVIVTADGYILTNAHVVNSYAERILVTLPSLERVNAHLVGWDHWTDLAVVKLDVEEVARRGLQFSYAEFGDDAELFPGKTVYAVGTPNGLTRTVSKGILSNVARFFEATRGPRGHETGSFNTWLQTDAAINPGNSGGPLVDNDGRIIGINTRGYLGANNLGFAVPAVTARNVFEVLRQQGAMVRGYSGLVFIPLRDLETFYELEMNEGVLVQSVDTDSPAALAGLRAGDVILSLNGVRLDGRFPEQLPAIQHSIADLGPGAQIDLQVKRGEHELPFQLVLEELESRIGEEDVLSDWGVSVRRLSRVTAREMRLGTTNGATVIGTQSGFPAQRAGLRTGDIIVSVNREDVDSLERLRDHQERWVEDPQPLLLEVLRNHQRNYVVIKP